MVDEEIDVLKELEILGYCPYCQTTDEYHTCERPLEKIRRYLKYEDVENLIKEGKLIEASEIKERIEELGNEIEEETDRLLLRNLIAKQEQLKSLLKPDGEE